MAAVRCLSASSPSIICSDFHRMFTARLLSRTVSIDAHKRTRDVSAAAVFVTAPDNLCPFYQNRKNVHDDILELL